MGMKVKGGSDPQSEINVTPLIDIVLVMLIIFMVLTPIQVEQMAVKLPDKTETMDQQEDLPEDQLVVAAFADGTLALNKKYMTEQELNAEVRLRLKYKRSRVVFVDADPNLQYGTVVHIMDLVRDAGAERVALAKLKDEGPPRP